MLQAYMIVDLNTRRCIVANEAIQKTLDEELVLSFIKSLEGVINTSFTTADIETRVQELSLMHGRTYFNFRWGNYIIGVILSSLESKRYATILAETVFEVESAFGDRLKGAFEENLVPEITAVTEKNFRDLIFEPVDDIGTVEHLLKEKDRYFMHTGREGALVYENKKKGAALRNFVNSYDSITFQAVDEVIAILRTDVIVVAALEDRIRLLSLKDLALTLRQLLRLNIIECYTQLSSSD